jgi:hypothetical protein
MLLDRQWVVEEDQDTIAGEVFECASVLGHELTQHGVVLPWYSRSTSNSSSGAAVSANAVKPRRSQKRDEMYARCPANSRSPSSLEIRSAT